MDTWKKSVISLHRIKGDVMRVAITGGSGFLGREVVSLIEKEKVHTPVVLGRNPSDGSKEYEYKQTDYSVDNLNAVLGDMDAVVHLAAIRGANGSIEDFHHNEIITENLFKSCVNTGIKNIVISSSIAVYSDVSRIPWDEEQLPSPKTIYGISKLVCEYLSHLYMKKHGLKVKSLRLAQILGDGERKGHMMNTFIDSAFEKRQLKVIGKSLAAREYVYVKDAARAILQAVAQPDVNGVFNIGSGQALTNLEIARLVNKCFHNEGNLDYNPSVSEEIESSLMDSSKAGNILGYNARFSICEALNDIKSIMQERVRNV